MTQYDSTGVQMVYDGDGNRVSKTAAGVTTQYLVDTLTPTRYAQVVEEIVGTSVNAQYLYGLMRISQSHSGTVSYYGYDGHGSVRHLLNGAGAVTDMYQYDAFGSLISRTGSTLNAYLFAGEQYDVDLNLYYLRARWYNQRTGRFITEDTYEGIANAPATLNRYVFAHSDPINLFDPTGRDAVLVEAEESPLQVTFGHGARHLFEGAGTGLSQAEVEAAITQAVNEIKASGQLAGNFFGFLNVGGVGLVYRAFILSEILINVGTYYPFP